MKDSPLLKNFNEGESFYASNIAAELGMSKKTIYATFRDKESMFLGMVDYCFDRIKIQKQLVLEDETLSTVEKIRKVLGVMPEGYKEIDLILESYAFSRRSGRVIIRMPYIV